MSWCIENIEVHIALRAVSGAWRVSCLGRINPLCNRILKGPSQACLVCSNIATKRFSPVEKQLCGLLYGILHNRVRHAAAMLGLLEQDGAPGL